MGTAEQRLMLRSRFVCLFSFRRQTSLSIQSDRRRNQEALGAGNIEIGLTETKTGHDVSELSDRCRRDAENGGEFSARHIQAQANEEIMIQRLEKVAQRRVDQRIEKIKSARNSRFDIRLNPFFSRPLDSAAKEVERQHQEQEKNRHRASPTHPTVLLRLDGNLPSPLDYRKTPVSSKDGPTESTSSTLRKIKKAHHVLDKDDDNESGPPSKSSGSPHRSTHRSATSKRSFSKSSSNRHSAATTTTIASTNHSISTTDISMITSVKSLKLIFSSNHRNPYQHLVLVDQIAYIYIQIVVLLGQKTMTGGQFRSFAR